MQSPQSLRHPPNPNNLGREPAPPQNHQANNSDTNSEKSDSENEGGEDDVDRISLHAGDDSITADAFLSENKDNSFSDDPMTSAMKHFTECFNSTEEKYGDEAPADVSRAVTLAFKETISEGSLKQLLEKSVLPENCKIAQAKKINPVVFSSVSPTIRSTDIKLQEIQRDMSKVSCCLIALLTKLPELFKGQGVSQEKTEAIQLILDGLKLAGHGNQSMNTLRKKSFLAGVSQDYKDLAKFALDSDTHLFGDELEDSIKKAKGRHHSLQALKKQDFSYTSPSNKRKYAYEKPKNDKPAKKPWTSGRKGYTNNKKPYPYPYQNKDKSKNWKDKKEQDGTKN